MCPDKPIETTRSLLVPTLSLFEVFRRVRPQRREGEALRVISVKEQRKGHGLRSGNDPGSRTALDPARYCHGGQRDAGHCATERDAALDPGFRLRGACRRQVPRQALLAEGLSAPAPSWEIGRAHV